MIFELQPQLLHKHVLAALEAQDGASLDDEADRHTVAQAVVKALAPLLSYVCDDCGRHLPIDQHCPGRYCRPLGGDE